MIDLFDYEMKAEAVKNLIIMNVDKKIISDFADNKVIYLFEDYNATAIQSGDLLEEIKRLEKFNRVLVYGVLLNKFYFGECYSMLCISPYREDLGKEINYTSSPAFNVSVNAYVWNKTDDNASEFGFIRVNCLAGGIKRVH
jgi:hypothetical protein